MTIDDLPQYPSKPPAREMSELDQEVETGDPEIDNLPERPIFINSAHGFDPRSALSYPESPEGKLDLLRRSESPDTDPVDVVMGDAMMAQFRINSPEIEHVPEFPPRPITVEELDQLIRSDRVEYAYEKVACWVDCEREHVKESAAGVYREQVSGYILRFWLELPNDQVLWYTLDPDFSPIGFSWYRGNKNHPMVDKHTLMDLSQARRLVSLLQADNPENILNPPDRVLDAALFLQTSLTGDEQSATPPNWIETLCEQNGEHSEIGLPRYDATFVHQPSGIVVEVSPVPPTETERTRMANKLRTTVQSMGMGPEHRPGLGNGNEGTDEEFERTHKVVVHFASDEIEQAIREQFGTEMTGPLVNRVMKRISKLA